MQAQGGARKRRAVLCRGSGGEGGCSNEEEVAMRRILRTRKRGGHRGGKYDVDPEEECKEVGMEEYKLASKLGE